ncbi:hypothetical protein G6O67_001488 [Ophiocordyceps sinensis]|uniref:Uncharacterized protein n=1 Tax=Ophiocordyceps sinensis TaxID=72228 RepID=A0A8H4PXP8_9HYPO|nr:hypothetical protein G6O67_001488 [Ophiocordyceps sinensis]
MKNSLVQWSGRLCESHSASDNGAAQGSENRKGRAGVAPGRHLHGGRGCRLQYQGSPGHDAPWIDEAGAYLVAEVAPGVAVMLHLVLEVMRRAGLNVWILDTAVHNIHHAIQAPVPSGTNHLPPRKDLPAEPPRAGTPAGQDYARSRDSPAV